MATAIKHMASNFAKLDKFKGVDFRRWQKKMHFLLSSMDVVYMLTTLIPEDGGDDATVEQIRKRAKWDNDYYVCKGLILNGMSDSLFDIYQNVESSKKDFKHTLKHLKDELTLVELGSHLRIEESLRVQDSDKPKSNNVDGPSVVNMVEHNNSSRYNDNKGVNVRNKANGSGTKGSEDGSSNSLKGQNMFNKSLYFYYVTYVSEAYFVQDDVVALWVDSRVTVHVCKDRCWFKTYESLNDRFILHIGNESTALVHGRGCVDLKFSSGKIISLFNVLHVPNIRKNLVSSSNLNNYGYKQVIESNKFVLSKHGVFIGFGYLSIHMFKLNIVNDNIGLAFRSTSKLNDSILWHARLGNVHFKRMQDMSKDGLIPAFDMDTEKCKTSMLTKITKKPFHNVKRETEVLELIHNDLIYMLLPHWGIKNKFKVFKTEVELQQGSLIKRFRTDRGGEYMDTLYFQTDSRVLGAVIRLLDPKLKTLGEIGIECIFVGYGEHSKAFRFSLVPRPSQRSLVNRTEDFGGLVVPEEVTKEYHKTIDFYDINSQSDYSSDGCLNEKLEDEVDLTKEFLSSRFSMKDMGKDDVILGIRIKHESNGIAISLSHYIEKVRKKFNYFECTPISTPMDTSEKLMPNNGQVVSQLAYYRVTGCLMYAMTYTTPDIAFAVGKPSRYTSNPGTQHWQAIQWVLKYLKKSIDYRLIYVGYPSVLEGYTDAIWISNTEDNSSTSGRVFLLGGGAVSWASKKKTCITGSTMEYEFMALAAAGKEAEWLKNLLIEIPLWSKPMAPISIRCDSAATLAKAYS
ncbi:zinc finger, CCHC-type containing protein [Tanacetum coccineum]